MFNFKTNAFNKIRRIYANRIGEDFLLKFVRGHDPRDFVCRFIPMPYLFPKPSWRTVERNEILLKLDISDLVDWFVYFDLKDDSVSFILNQLKKDDIVLDIGTNIGYVALRCAKLVHSGKVFGFEPSQHNYFKYKTNHELNKIDNLIVFNAALGAKPDILKLEVVSENNRGMNRISVAPTSECEIVNVITLDQKVQVLKLPKVDFIKIDVEGYEMNILAGATHTISTFRPKIFLEVNKDSLHNFGSTPVDLFHWLMDRQYNIFNLRGKRITSYREMETGHMDVLACPVEKDPSNI